MCSPRKHFTVKETVGIPGVVPLFAISIALLLLPNSCTSRNDTDGRHSCQHNLHEIARLAIIYGDHSGNGFFPIADGENPPAHESLNLLIDDSNREGPTLRPRLFTCRKMNVVYTDGSVRFVPVDELGPDQLPPGLVR